MFRIAILITLALGCQSMSEFPNAILSEPEVRCGNDDVTIAVITDNKKPSHIFAKGHAGDEHCVFRNVDQASFSLSRCGMSRKRQLEPKGLMFNLIVIVQLHPFFVTKVDKAYNLKCFYMELDRTVTNQLEISAIPTVPMRQFSEMPTCTYRLLSGSPEGEPVRFARVGDKVFHVWDCPSSMYGMLVHSCVVTSGDGQEQMIIDEKGCGVDQYLIGTPNYTPSATTAIQETHVFKFADRVTVMFNCQIKLCMQSAGSCDGITPPNCNGPAATVGTDPYLDNTDATLTIPPATDTIAEFISTTNYSTAQPNVTLYDTDITHFTLPSDSTETTPREDETTRFLNDSAIDAAPSPAPTTANATKQSNEVVSTARDTSDFTDTTLNADVGETSTQGLTGKTIRFPATPFVLPETTALWEDRPSSPAPTETTENFADLVLDTTGTTGAGTSKIIDNGHSYTTTQTPSTTVHRDDVIFEATRIPSSAEIEEMLNYTNISAPFPLGPLAESLLLDDTTTVFTLINETVLNETVLERLAVEKNSVMETGAQDVMRVVASTNETVEDGTEDGQTPPTTLPPHIVERLVRRFQEYNAQQDAGTADRPRRNTPGEIDLAMDVQQRMIVLEPSDVDDDVGPVPGRLALSPSGSQTPRSVCLSQADVAGICVAFLVILAVCTMLAAWAYRKRRLVEAAEALPTRYAGFR